MSTSSERQVVVFRGGFAADWLVVRRLLDLEARGARFELLPDGRIRVSPSGVLDAASRDFLRRHQDEARAACLSTRPRHTRAD
jgi:hypothetical protein